MVDNMHETMQFINYSQHKRMSFCRHALIYFKSIEDAGTAVLTLEDVSVGNYDMEVQVSHDTERMMRLMQTSTADYLRVVSEPVAQDIAGSRNTHGSQPKPQRREFQEQPRRGIPEPRREFYEQQRRDIPEKPKQGISSGARSNGRDEIVETDSWPGEDTSRNRDTTYNGARPKQKIDSAYLNESLSMVASLDQDKSLGEWQNLPDEDEPSLDEIMEQEEKELQQIEKEIAKLRKRREEILQRQRQRHITQTEGSILIFLIAICLSIENSTHIYTVHAKD